MAGNNKTPVSRGGRAPGIDALREPVPDSVRDLLAPAHKQSPQNRAAAEAARALLGTPPPPEVTAALKGEDKAFQQLVNSFLKRDQVAVEDTLDPGESLTEPTVAQLLKRKLALDEMDVLLAAPMPEVTEALRLGLALNKDGSDRLYIGPKGLNDILTSGGAPGIKSLTTQTLGEAQRSIASRYLGIITEIDPGSLHPLLQKRMLTDGNVANYVEYAINAGNKAGINGVMYANQLWQESRFDPDAVSGKGAAGISQMMPYHKGKYGLGSRSDFFDPYKSIDAGAQMMFEMTNRFKDQRLALVAYNGGERAIEFVEKRLGKGQITYADWHGFMENRRSTNPTNDPSAWQNETKNYIDVIAGKPTPEEKAKPAAPAPVPR